MSMERKVLTRWPQTQAFCFGFCLTALEKKQNPEWKAWVLTLVARYKLSHKGHKVWRERRKMVMNHNYGGNEM